MKAAKITWIDSSGVQGGWQFLEDFDTELVEVTSIGFIVKENDALIALALNVGKETINAPTQINGVITIPKCAISSISFLEISSCSGLASG